MWVPRWDALRHRVLGLAAGLLLGLPHTFPALAPLQLVALLPLLLALDPARARRRDALTVGVYMGLAFVLPQALVLRLPVQITLVLIVHLTLWLTAFALGCHALLRGPAVLGALAIGAWFVVIDWANCTALPMWGTAQSLVRPWSRWPWAIQFTSITGITAIPFFVAALQALGLRLRSHPGNRPRVAVALGVLCAVWLALDLAAFAPRPTGSVKVAAIGWIPQDEREQGYVDAGGYEALFARPVAEVAAQGARIVACPETAFNIGKGDRAQRIAQFAELARAHSLFLAIGYFDMARLTNRVMVIDPEGNVAGEHTKVHLTPFEDYGRGDGRPMVVQGPGAKLGAMICHDDNHTDLSRAMGRVPVGIVVVPTEDWRPIRTAHFQGSVHRCIESRFAIVRAARGGISAVVDGRGRVLAARDHFTEGPGPVVAEVPLYASRSPFSIIGHWPPFAALAFLAAWVARVVVVGRRKKREQAAVEKEAPT